MQGAKRSNSGAMASICNAADRPSPQILRHEEWFSISQVLIKQLPHAG